MNRERLILAMLDMAKGARIGHYFRLFSSSLRWSREELDRYRLLRLKELLETCSTPEFEAGDFYLARLAGDCRDKPGRPEVVVPHPHQPGPAAGHPVLPTRS